jgi:type IV pilus assembly protein PilP
MILRRALLMIAALLLAGCGLSSEDEIRQWMDDLRRKTKPVVQPVPPPKSFTPHLFTETDRPDPFDMQKIAALQGRPAPTNANKPDENRRSEALEAYSLDQLHMVGALKQGAAFVALIDAGGSTHMLRVGNYIGQNMGRVTRVTETQVDLVESVQDATGDWVERPAKLELRESAARQQGSKK